MLAAWERMRLHANNRETNNDPEWRGTFDLEWDDDHITIQHHSGRDTY
jgi:hypothetical protein